jgi:hypothetical protein
LIPTAALKSKAWQDASIFKIKSSIRGLAGTSRLAMV